MKLAHHLHIMLPIALIWGVSSGWGPEVTAFTPSNPGSHRTASFQNKASVKPLVMTYYKDERSLNVEPEQLVSTTFKEVSPLAKGKEPEMEEVDKDDVKQDEVSGWNKLWKGLPLNVISQRMWDTAEDAVVHLGRNGHEKNAKDTSRKTIVVLGSGWGAHAFMKVADSRKLRIVVVSPTNHFVFTPMLASAAVGTIECRSMTEPVRASNPLIDEYIQGSATAVNLKGKTITVKRNKMLEEDEAETIDVPYDHLVVSVGSVVHDFNIPGVKEHCLTLKTTEDARNIRRAVGECLELASSVSGPDTFDEQRRRATVLIAGGGPTGVELAGELSDLFADTTRPSVGPYANLVNATRVIVVEGGPSLVPPFNERLRAEALKTLQAEGVEVHLNTFVKEVGEKYVRLSAQVDPLTGQKLNEPKEFEVPIGLAVWAAGTKPVPFVEELLKEQPPEAKHRDGRIKVDGWMRPPMNDPELLGSVLVLGDAAALANEDSGKQEFLPPTAQVAGQQGAYLARTLSRGYNLATNPPQLKKSENGEFDNPEHANWLRFRHIETAPKFHFLNLGVLAYVGSGAALSQIQLGEAPLLSKAGLEGFLLCKSVYFAKQVSLRNRVLIAFDWMKSKVFGRDITRF